MRANPTRSWLWAAVLSCGCNALLGIDEPKTISPDAPIAYDAKPMIFDAPRPPDAPIVFDAPPVTADAARFDAPLAFDAPAADAAPFDARAFDAATVDAAPIDAP